jgi:type VI protein secretion system component VasK
VERIQTLTDAVRDLRGEAQEIRRELKRRTTLLAWLFAAGAVILACALLAAYTVSLNNQRAIEESNRKWCPMVQIMIPRPGEAQATTERGRQFVDNARQLYADFGCGIAK